MEGMEAGADDYLIKPFSARELLARVRAHIRIAKFRKQAAQHEVRLEGELQEARRLAAEAVENITDSFIAVDFDWRFTYLNPKAKQMVRTAGAQGDVVGRNLWETFPGLEATEFGAQYRRCMEMRVPVQFDSLFRERWYAVRAYPAPAGIVIYAVDVTAHRAAQDDLRMKQEHLLLTQKAAKIGTWELDLEEESLAISEEFAEIAGLHHVSRIRYADFMALLFLSEDRKKAQDALQKALRRKKEFSIELRLKRKDGSVRLVSCRGKLFYNQGKPVVLGVLVDLSSSRSANTGKTEKARKPDKGKTSQLKKIRKSA